LNDSGEVLGRGSIPSPQSSEQIAARIFVYASDSYYLHPDREALPPYVKLYRDADLLIFDAQFTLLKAMRSGHGATHAQLSASGWHVRRESRTWRCITTVRLPTMKRSSIC
jgi:hypothetical protein